MTFRTITLATVLTGATAMSAYALEAGGSVGVDAGVSGAVDGVGDVGTSTGADVNAGVEADTQGAAGTIATATDAATDAAASLQAGTPIVSADGQLIGEIEATREAEDGRTQAIIAVNESAGLSAGQIAVNAEGLKKTSAGTVEYGHSMADLRAGVEAQVGANADVSN
ncbi:hypothetical protein [Maritimibacter sp. 55A14]|uniref:hypothetical protein n=1 Tax=Maritimibacter sp. 55A14 TaxID=2174844 RepID=UPI0011B1CCA2|nr:hypothetical protein [Maritimibacter sp. 55A14]